MVLYIDDKKENIYNVIKNSWYIGLDLNHPYKIFKENWTVKKQIEYGIKKHKTELDFETIKVMFRLSDERINRNIKYVSGERWKASAAIGYANGKNIFCYPWFNTYDFELFGEQISYTIKCLLNFGKLVILPTTKEKNINSLGLDYDIIKL